MQPYDYIEVKIPAKEQYIGVARLAISGLASRIGFSYDDIEDLKIASSEAITNAVQHAYADNELGEVVVGCALFTDKMEIMIADNGASFNYEETKNSVGPYKGKVEVEFLREGGLGLYLMETLMDEVKVYHEEGVTVLMTKYLEGERVDKDAETISS
ncbi:anti-sigma B factor RsbW [Sporosarcina sp. FA9]|uniref:anti-sigma B factor RsbW n=1 Tax=Sporosarcina sp. FA9 TaxID=3413030 RepID=UPI003F658BE5